MRQISMSLALVALMLTAATTAPAPAAPARNGGPSIGGGDHSPAWPLPDQDIFLDIDVSGATSVNCWWAVSTDGPWTPEAMAEAGPSYWTCTVTDPPTTDGGVFLYYFEADDGVFTDYWPAGAPAIWIDAGVSYEDEAVGVYFGSYGADNEVMTSGDDDVITMRVCLRFPHIWIEKATALVHSWDLQVVVENGGTVENWAYAAQAVNELDKGDRPPPPTDQMFPMLVTPADYGGVLSDPDGYNMIELARADITVPFETSQILIYIKPRVGYDAPMYRPNGLMDPWRPLGTSSGGDPNDPVPNWDVPVAYINTSGPVADSRSTWGGVKTLFR